MSLRTIIQNVAADLALSEPSTVIGNSNSQIKQLLQLAQREGKDLASRYRWRALVRQEQFTYSTGDTDQGALNGTVVSDGDVEYIIGETFWNQTLDEPVRGPLSDAEIEQLAAFPVTGPYERWWISGKNLYIDPAPTSADTAQFAYKSTFWCETSGGTGQAKWAADTDVGRLDENIMELGILWRWLRRKGMDYSEEFKTYETRVADAMARDGGQKPRLRMDGSRTSRTPGVFVPQGSWNL